MTVSYKKYNGKIGLALFCPITSKVKGYPFEVEVSGKAISGSVLSDVITNIVLLMRD